MTLSPAQIDFLRPFYEEFRRLQGLKCSLADFWDKVFHQFFLEWVNQASEPVPPEEPRAPKLTKGGKVSKRQPDPKPPAPVIIYDTDKNWKDARESQIRFWFYNHAAGIKKKAKAKVKIVVGIGKKERVLPEHQLYSKKYYADRIKGKVDEELVGIKDNALRIATTARIVKETWENESKKIRQEISAEHERLVKEKKDADSTMKKVFEHGDPKMTLEEYAVVQEAIPELLESFCETMAAKTGWAFTIIAGGPMASQPNAPIRVCTFHEGTIPGTDQTFRGWYPDFDQTFSAPFSTFAHSVYPEAERLRRAVSIEMGKVTSAAALKESGRRIGQLEFIAGEAGAAVASSPDGGNGGDGGATSGSDSDDASGSDDEGKNTKKSKKGQKGKKASKTGKQNARADDTDTETQRPVLANKPKKGKGKGKIRAKAGSGESNGMSSSSESGDDSEEEEPVTRKKGKGRGKKASQKAEKAKQKGEKAKGKTKKKGTDTTQEASEIPLRGVSNNGNENVNQSGMSTSGPNGGGMYGAGMNGAGMNGAGMNGSGMNGSGMNGSGMNGGSMNGGGMYGGGMNSGGMNGAGMYGGGMYSAGMYGGGMNGSGMNGGSMNGGGMYGVGMYGGGMNGGGMYGSGMYGVGMINTGMNNGGMNGGGTDGYDNLLDEFFDDMNNEMYGGGGGDDDMHSGNMVDPAWETLRRLPINRDGREGEGEPDDGSGAPQAQRMGSYVMPAGGLGVGPVGGVAEPSGGDLRKRRLPAEDTEEAGEDQSTGQRGKRHRRTNQAIVPEWVTEAHTHLLSRTEDVVWQELVELWHGFEVSYSRMGGAGMANLAASMRPAELNKWVKTRQFSSIPEITDIQQFGRDWSAWWAQLTTKKGSKTGEEDLRGVKKAGPLGVVVAVIGLGWWCDGGEEWKAAVVKARAVLKQFGTPVVIPRGH